MTWISFLFFMALVGVLTVFITRKDDHDSSTGYFVDPFKTWADAIHGFHFIGLIFAVLIGAMLLVGKIAPRAEAFEQQDVKAVDMTLWPHARLTGALLCLAVLVIYTCLADFSVLK